jgi:hypothetical protein
MLIDRYAPEDVFARVPELAGQTDPLLKQLDVLLKDDQLFQQVKADLTRRFPHAVDRGRHLTPVEAILRLLLIKHLYNWSFQQTEERVADSLVLRWFRRVYFRILYPCLRLVLAKVKIERMGSLPPRLINPLSMKPLDLKIESSLRPAATSKGQSLMNFTSQLAVDAFQQRGTAYP